MLRLFVVIAVVIALLLVLRRSRGDRVSAAERRLRRKVGPASAESLIEFEMNQDPRLSRGDAAARALDRYIYDRTR